MNPATRPMQNNILHCFLHFPRDWDFMPRLTETPQEVEQFFQGQSPAEWLSLSFMAQADPQANLRNWLEPIVALTGFPFPSAAASRAAWELREWEYQGNWPGDPFQLDELHLYRGRAARGRRHPSLTQLYALLARRGSSAWKFGLSLSEDAAVSQGEATPAPADQRAAAIFGHLRFLEPDVAE